MKKEIKNLNTQTINLRFQFIYKAMLLYCLKCRKNTVSEKPKVVQTKNRGIMLL